MDTEAVQLHDHLLDELYDAVLAPDGFQPFLRVLAETFRLKGVVLVGRNTQTLDGTGIWQHGQDPYWMEQYALTYSREDILAAHIAAAPVGHFYASNLHLPEPERLIENRFFREYALPQGMAFAAASIVLREGPWQNEVFLQRSQAQGPFTHAEVAQFDRLVPHWQRAVQMRQRLLALQVGRELLAASLDAIAMPALLFDESGVIAHRNRGALELLATGDALRELDGRLVGTAPVATRELQLQISNAVRTHREGRAVETSIVSVRRPGRLALTTTILPLRARVGQSAPAAALMFLFDPERMRNLTADMVRQLFGLTSIEAELAVALCGGQSLDEVALERRRSLATVRSQLRGLFAKTGTSRQSDLIGLLLASPAGFLSQLSADAIC